MTKEDKKKLKKEEKDIQAELTADLQRIRADFENYRKMTEVEKTNARQAGRESAIKSILPVIDTIDRAISHIPEELANDQWVKGVAGLAKQLDKVLSELKIEKISAEFGVEFNPELHQAVQFDDDAEGDKEVISEELQSGYTLDGRPLRHAMVKVTRQ